MNNKFRDMGEIERIVNLLVSDKFLTHFRVKYYRWYALLYWVV